MKIQQNTDIQLTSDEVKELLLAGIKAKHKKLLPVEFDPKSVKLEFVSDDDSDADVKEATLKFPMIEQAGPTPSAEA